MHFSSLLLLGAVTASVCASRHVVHEERSVVPPGWMKHSRLDPDAVLPVRIGLTQSNLDKAYDVLTDVSDDESPNYGNHWSDKRIADFFAPSRHTVSTVRNWLNASGICTKRIQQSSNRGWLHFEATVAEMEELLKTTYWKYEHDTGKAHSSCHEYSVPEHVSKHIDFITPTIHFDAQVPRGSGMKTKRSTTDGSGMSNGPRIGKTVPAPPKHLGNTFVGGSACNAYDFVTPACLRELYNMPRGTKNLSSFGIVEYFPQTYLQSDLDAFQSLVVTNDAGMPIGTTPNTEAIDGGSVLTSDELGAYASDYYAESDLDLQYAMDLVWPQQVTLFQTGDNGTDSEGVISFNNFLDGIDGVYCSTAGGDTPGFDQSFPDANGYNHTEDCGLWAPTSVISTSYGYNEHDLSPAYERRQCNEYMKLGLKGVSFIYSSGDNGVGGNGATCIAPDGSYTDGSSGRFNPLFPGTCPYVTTVGATELAANNTASAPEVACETVIYSGGGFSNVFPSPSHSLFSPTSPANHPP